MTRHPNQARLVPLLALALLAPRRISAQSNFGAPAPAIRADSTPVSGSTASAHGWPRGLHVKYDKFTDSTVVIGGGTSSGFLDLEPATWDAYFFFPGRVYMQAPSAVWLTVEITEVGRTLDVVQAQAPAAEVQLLLDDSVRFRYPTAAATSHLDLINGGTAGATKSVTIVIPVADFVRIAAARKVEVNLPEKRFKMGGDGMRLLAEILTPDSAIAK